MDVGIEELTEVYVPKKTKKPLTNKEILERHRKNLNETRTIEVRQVDVEKVIDKVAPDSESESASSTSSETPPLSPITTTPMRRIKVIRNNSEPLLENFIDPLTIEESPKENIELSESSEEDCPLPTPLKKNTPKPGIIEKNGEGIQIRDEEELQNIHGIDRKLFGQLLELATHVYRELGPGHTENIYHKALALELRNNHILYESEKRVLITYHDRQSGKKYTLGEERIDLFLVDYSLIIELKAVTNEPREIELAQIRKYYRELLKADYILENWGLLINFPQPGPTKKAREHIDFVLVRL